MRKRIDENKITILSIWIPNKERKINVKIQNVSMTGFGYAERYEY